MLRLNISLATKSLRQPLRRALETAKRLGATAVEIDLRSELPLKDLSDTALRQIRKLLTDNDLRVAAVSFPTRRGYQVEHELERRIAATKQAMTAAHTLGAPVVVNQIGLIPDAEQDPPAWELLLEVLRDLGRHGDRCGAWLAARTGVSSGADLRRLLDALPAGALVVALDPAGSIAQSHAPLEMVEQVGQQIWHVYARDAVRDAAAGRTVEVELGRGSVDWPALLGALEERDYRGTLCIERNDSDDPQFDVGQAVKYLKNLD